VPLSCKGRAVCPAAGGGGWRSKRQSRPSRPRVRGAAFSPGVAARCCGWHLV
jgi:hypothetical protein